MTPPSPLTSFPNYGGFFPSFPFQGLNSQFGASQAPFGGGYGAWGMPGMGGMGMGYPSLFGGGFMPQQYGNPGAGMGGMPGAGMGGMMGAGTAYPGGSATFNENPGFPFGSGTGMPGGGAASPPMQQLGAMGSGTTGMQAPGNPGAALQQFPNGAMTPPGAANGASPAPQAPSAANFGAPPSFNATQLAQANGVSPGLADFMLNHNQGNPSANQQFEQAAGFTNPAGSQTALNQAGRNWIMNNEQSYGNINADAGQASPHGHMGYGMDGNTPYSYSLGQAATNPALQQWLLRARSGLNAGPPPTGANLYGQFAGGSGG